MVRRQAVRVPWKICRATEQEPLHPNLDMPQDELLPTVGDLASWPAVMKYKATGSVEAKKIGGSNPKKTVPAVVEAIIKHKTNEPQLKTWELRDRLIADAVCDTSSIPTIPSINRIIRLYFGRYYSRRKENGQSASAMKADDRSRERKIQAQDVQGTISLSWQSSSCSEASITSLDEFWLHPLSPGFQEGLMLTQSIIESQNDDLYGDNNAASFEYSIVC
uniref:Paired domain-containing protein n=1 Tax=Plectus sambesii TaxID=2011161 RepID=A0A914VXN2_9BILA